MIKHTTQASPQSTNKQYCQVDQEENYDPFPQKSVLRVPHHSPLQGRVMIVRKKCFFLLYFTAFSQEWLEANPSEGMNILYTGAI